MPVSYTQVSFRGRPALDVSWVPPRSDLAIQKYILIYTVDGGKVTNISTTGTSAQLHNLQMGAIYKLSVLAVSILGEGPMSDWTNAPAPSGEDLL